MPIDPKTREGREALRGHLQTMHGSHPTMDAASELLAAVPALLDYIDLLDEAANAVVRESLSPDIESHGGRRLILRFSLLEVSLHRADARQLRDDLTRALEGDDPATTLGHLLARVREIPGGRDSLLTWVEDYFQGDIDTPALIQRLASWVRVSETPLEEVDARLAALQAAIETGVEP